MADPHGVQRWGLLHDSVTTDLCCREGTAGRMSPCPSPIRKEFRDDVVAVARSRPKDTTLKQVALDFGISDSCLANWLAVAEADEGRRAGPTSEEITELRSGQAADPLARAGERGAPSCGGLSVPGKPAPKMMYPLVSELADDGIPLTVTCRMLKLVRQDYYRWLAVPVTPSELEEAYLSNALFDAHHDDPEFGYRFLTDEVRDGGFEACERTVWKVCSQNGWWSSFGKKKSRKKKGIVGTPAHDDLVRRQFSADAPNHLWLGDITEHPTKEGKLYICAIKDVFSNRIVGYSIDERMKARLAVAALNGTGRPVEATSPAAYSTPTADLNSVPAKFIEPWSAIAWWDQWVRWVRRATTRQWSPSSPYCKRTSSTASAGTPEKSSGSPSSPGSSGRITVAVAKMPWAG